MNEKEQLVRKAVRNPRRTLDKCTECGGDLVFRRYGLVDNEGAWHPDYPDWYRCVKCKSWELAYTIVPEAVGVSAK